MAFLRRCCTIRRIVRLRQMLRRWKARACGCGGGGGGGGGGGMIPADVPVGHLAVCVGTSCRRFVVSVAYLNHPLFRKLLVQAEEEYGFDHPGPIAIPCDEAAFVEILRCLESRSTACDAGVRAASHHSVPLLQGYRAETSSVC